MDSQSKIVRPLKGGFNGWVTKNGNQKDLMVLIKNSGIRIETMPIIFKNLFQPFNYYKFMESINNIQTELQVDSQKIIRKFDNLPDSIKKNLFKFQKRGVEFGIERNCRILIADEMGVGKTLQALCLAFIYKDQWPLLIICPSCLRFTIKQEILHWFSEFINESLIQVISKGTDQLLKKSEIVIISFDVVSNLKDVIEVKKFQTCIIDEAHYLKSLDSLRSINIVPLVEKMKNVILLTGTPALSKPRELYNILRIIRPDVFKDFKEFGYRYCNPRLNQVINSLNYDGCDNEQELNFILQEKIMIRRLKQDILPDLPEKRRKKVIIEISQAIKNKINKAIKQANANKQLEQYSEIEYQSDSDMYQENYDEMKKTFSFSFLKMFLINKVYQETGIAKLDSVKEYLSDLLDSKVKLIIFAHHKQVLDKLEDIVKCEYKRDYIRIDGNVKQEDRTNQQTSVAILSLQAASHGITLTASSHVIFAELYPTPAVMLQAEDRSHRINQSNNVLCHYLIGKDTIDEDIFELLQKKYLVTSSILDGQRKSLQIDEYQLFQFDKDNLVENGGDNKCRENKREEEYEQVQDDKIQNEITENHIEQLNQNQMLKMVEVKIEEIQNKAVQNGNDTNNESNIIIEAQDSQLKEKKNDEGFIKDGIDHQLSNQNAIKSEIQEQISTKENFNLTDNQNVSWPKKENIGIEQYSDQIVINLDDAKDEEAYLRIFDFLKKQQVEQENENKIVLDNQQKENEQAILSQNKQQDQGQNNSSERFKHLYDPIEEMEDLQISVDSYQQDCKIIGQAQSKPGSAALNYFDSQSDNLDVEEDEEDNLDKLKDLAKKITKSNQFGQNELQQQGSNNSINTSNVLQSKQNQILIKNNTNINLYTTQSLNPQKVIKSNNESIKSDLEILPPKQLLTEEQFSSRNSCITCQEEPLEQQKFIQKNSKQDLLMECQKQQYVTNQLIQQQQQKENNVFVSKNTNVQNSQDIQTKEWQQNQDCLRLNINPQLTYSQHANLNTQTFVSSHNNNTFNNNNSQNDNIFKICESQHVSSNNIGFSTLNQSRTESILTLKQSTIPGQQSRQQQIVSSVTKSSINSSIENIQEIQISPQIKSKFPSNREDDKFYQQSLQQQCVNDNQEFQIIEENCNLQQTEKINNFHTEQGDSSSKNQQQNSLQSNTDLNVTPKSAQHQELIHHQQQQNNMTKNITTVNDQNSLNTNQSRKDSQINSILHLINLDCEESSSDDSDAERNDTIILSQKFLKSNQQIINQDNSSKSRQGNFQKNGLMNSQNKINSEILQKDVSQIISQNQSEGQNSLRKKFQIKLPLQLQTTQCLQNNAFFENEVDDDSDQKNQKLQCNKKMTSVIKNYNNLSTQGKVDSSLQFNNTIRNINDKCNVNVYYQQNSKNGSHIQNVEKRKREAFENQIFSNLNEFDCIGQEEEQSLKKKQQFKHHK